MDAGLGVLHFLARHHHVVARLERLALHDAGFLEHVVQDLVQLGDVLGLADLGRIAADLFVEVAGRGGHLAQAVDKGHHHVLDGELDVRQAVLELALLVDHVLQAARGVLQRALVQRAGDQGLHGVDLPAQPGIVVQQFADVLQQQAEQAQQQFLLLGRVAALQFDLVAQLLEAQRDFRQRRLGVGFLGGRAQRLGFGHQRRRAAEQRGDGKTQRAAQHFAQRPGVLAVRNVGHVDAAPGRQRALGQLGQGARVAFPVARLDGAAQAAAEVGQVAGLLAEAGGELVQHQFRAGVGRRGSAGQHRGRRRRAGRPYPGDLVVDVAVSLRRGRDAARGQTAESFPRNVGRILLHRGGRGRFTGHVTCGLLSGFTDWLHDSSGRLPLMRG